MNKNNKGGYRKGSGRKPGRNKITKSWSISPEWEEMINNLISALRRREKGYKKKEI